MYRHFAFLFLFVIILSCRKKEEAVEVDDSANPSALISGNWQSVYSSNHAFGYVGSQYAIDGLSGIDPIHGVSNDNELNLIVNFKHRNRSDVETSNYKFMSLTAAGVEEVDSTSTAPTLGKDVNLRKYNQSNNTNYNGFLFWFDDDNLFEGTMLQTTDQYFYNDVFNPSQTNTFEVYPEHVAGNWFNSEYYFSELKRVSNDYLVSGYFVDNVNNGISSSLDREWGIWLHSEGGVSKKLPFDTAAYRPNTNWYHRFVWTGAFRFPRFYQTHIRTDKQSNVIAAITSRDTTTRDGSNTIRWTEKLHISVGDINDNKMTYVGEIPFQEEIRDPSKVLDFFESGGKFYLVLYFENSKSGYEIYTIEPTGSMSKQYVSSGNSQITDYGIQVVNDKIYTISAEKTGSQMHINIYEVANGSLSLVDESKFESSDIIGHSPKLFSSDNALYLTYRNWHPDYAPCCPYAYKLEIFRYSF